MAGHHYVTLLLSFALVSTLCSGGASNCPAAERHVREHMSTKTPYDFVHGNVTRMSPESNCKPVQIWALMRHGTRYPKKKQIKSFRNLLPGLRDQIIENHEKKTKDQLCPDDFEKLRAWSTARLKKMKPMALAPKGVEEFRSIARRLKDTFPELLNIDPRLVTKSDFKFRSTVIERARHSLKAFKSEFFNGSKTIKPEKAPENDTLLHLSENCPGWWTERDKENQEKDKFLKSPEYLRTLQRVSQRLGLDRILRTGLHLSHFIVFLPTDELKAIYDSCRFELAWDPDQPSAWCAAFDAEDLSVLEYREDLSRYYRCGPGREINAHLGCPTLHDMIKHFRNLEHKKTARKEPKGIFYFSHTETLQAMMTAMGLGKEPSPLLATNYEQKKDRNYRTSFLGSFATNVIGVFYKCHDEKSPHKVMFYIAEKLQKFDGCDDGVCDWEFIKQKFSNAIHKCDLSFCYESL